MKIAYLIPGSGGSFYCGNCFRDNVFIDALKLSGHEIFMIPMYLPLSIDQYKADSPIFYGAVNIYLEQLSPLFKKMPEWLKAKLDSEKVLRFVGKLSGSTKAEGNESMTISMLKGAAGKQSDDLDVLINWLKEHEKPDVVHLSNALLSGMAEKLKKELGCAVVCTLQDEDEWIDDMRQPYSTNTWKLIEANAHYIDAFISVSDYYARFIASKIQIPADKIHVVYNCVDVDSVQKNVQKPISRTIGYMSKINSAFGSDLLFDAFLELKKEKQFSDLKLKFTGGFTDDYKRIVKNIRQKIKKYRLEEDVEFWEDLSAAGKKQFLESISVFCVPSRRKEAFGIHILEAFSAEVPVVMPDIGGYSEIITKSKAGLLYNPNVEKSLVDTLRKLLTDGVIYQKLKQNCHKAIQTDFNTSIQANKVLEVYSDSIKKINFRNDAES